MAVPFDRGTPLRDALAARAPASMAEVRVGLETSRYNLIQNGAHGVNARERWSEALRVGSIIFHGPQLGDHFAHPRPSFIAPELHEGRGPIGFGEWG